MIVGPLAVFTGDSVANWQPAFLCLSLHNGEYFPAFLCLRCSWQTTAPRLASHLAGSDAHGPERSHRDARGRVTSRHGTFYQSPDTNVSAGEVFK